MIKRSAIASACLASVVSFASYAEAQEKVYYCIEGQSIGFDDSGDGYKPTNFTTDRFTIKLGIDSTGSYDIIKTLDGKSVYFPCKQMAGYDERLQCRALVGYTFEFNLNNGRFVSTLPFGYVFGSSDSVAITIGTCSAF